MMRFAAAVARTLVVVVLAACAGVATAQQAYPGKPIRFIVPYTPGGSIDPMARMAAVKLSEKLGQAVIVENRPGGNAVIGNDIVAKAPPDGYTLLIVGAPFVVSPSLLSNLPYDTIRDFDAVATISKFQHVLVLNPSMPANTLQEFMALARSRPGQFNYGSSGVGSGIHLSGELFNILVGTKMQHVPYKGSSQVITDLIGGQIQLSFQVPIAALAHIRSGKLKAIAVSGETRLAALPQVPTFAESGLAGYELAGWFGIVAPARTPKEIIDRISGEMATILAMRDIQEYLANQGFEPFISPPGQMAALIKADIAKYARVIKAANIKLED